MEEYKPNPEANPDAAKWDNMDGSAETQEEVKTLPLYTEVMNGAYKIASQPFERKEDAYEEIKNFWQGADVTTYQQGGYWYIIERK